MAKQVKVFDVTVGVTETAVYTVPAGRVAKVILSKYSAGSGLLKIGSSNFGSTSSEFMQSLPNVSNEELLQVAFLATVYSANRNHYLPAGATVIMRNASANFCVIEEF